VNYGSPTLTYESLCALIVFISPIISNPSLLGLGNNSMIVG